MPYDDLASMSDPEIVDAMLRRDTRVTRWFLYSRCLPLFASVHARYFTDCASPEELIGEIYLYIMTPGKTTGRSKLEDFGFRCSLPMWLKVVAANYCHQLFSRRIPRTENISPSDDRFPGEEHSLLQNSDPLDVADVKNLLAMMPNERYRRLIQLRYVDELSNEDTARILGMTMANYYNCHKRAKEQYCEILKKEGLL